MGINKRVEKIIEHVASSKAEFASKTGISAVILSHISSGRNKVSLNAVEMILKAYPQLSTDYLVLGKGSMFRESQNSELLDSIHLIKEQAENMALVQQKSLKEHINKLEAILNSLET